MDPSFVNKQIAPSNITLTKKLVYEESVRIVVGIAIVVVNTCLLMILNGTRHIQKKFALYSLVTIGDEINGLYFIYPSLRRIIDVATDDYYNDITRRECLMKMYILPRVFGTNLVAVTILVLAIEKIFAVLFPVFYRLYSFRLRWYMEGVAFGYCIFCLIWMFLSVMLDPKPKAASDSYCGLSTSASESFNLYHQYSQIAINVLAFILSVIAFSIAWNRSKISQLAKKNLQLIQPILVVSAISTAILIASNIIFILKAINVPRVTKAIQNIIVTYSSAGFTFSKIFVYLLTGKEFRMAVSAYWRRSTIRETVRIIMNFLQSIFNLLHI